MILGVHSATFVKNWHEDVKPYIHLCKKAGYKSVEVSLLGQTPSTAKEIAKLLNIEGSSSYVRVSQLKKQAVDKLIDNVDHSQVLDYL